MRKAIVMTALTVFSAATLSAAPALAGRLNMKPGLWKMNTKLTMNMQGMPFPMPNKTQTTKQCITKKKLEHPWKSLQSHKRASCKFTNVKVSGSRASWVMKCTGKAQGTGHGKVVVDSPTQIREVMDLTMNASGHKMHMHADAKGHWIGTCGG